MSITTEMIGKALSTVIDDNLKTDYVSAKWVKNIDIDGNDVSLTVELGYPAKSLHEFIRNRIATCLLYTSWFRKSCRTVCIILSKG